MLHISPESAMTDSVFGIIEDGDVVKLDAEKRSLDVELSNGEISRRMESRSSKQEEPGKKVGKRKQ